MKLKKLLWIHGSPIKIIFLKYFLLLTCIKIINNQILYVPKFCSFVVLSELKKNFNYFLFQLLYIETRLRYFCIHINNFIYQKISGINTIQ